MTTSKSNCQFLLLQVRDQSDLMRPHEVASFARALGCAPELIRVHDLMSGHPRQRTIDESDIVLVGGSGDYSVVQEKKWLPAALDLLRELVAQSKPMFGSCWGFQALAKALGGTVVTDIQLAEIGTHSMTLTAVGTADPVFGPLAPSFYGQLGHQDIVIELPEEAELLCSTEKVPNQAFRLAGKPIYATQFHPELELKDLIIRLDTYPAYVKEITGLEMEEFKATHCKESPDASRLLANFVRHVMDPASHQ